jgi:putative ABC transport system permease protein
MWKNYLTIAWRTIVKNQRYTVINLAGLSVGLSVGLLLFFYVRHELSFESFSEHSERMYRLYSSDVREAGNDVAQVTQGMAALMQKEIPEIEAIVEIGDPKHGTITVGDAAFAKQCAYPTSPSVFMVFHFPLREGNEQTALTAPNAAVISTETAALFFGDDSPLGKTFSLRRWDDSQTVFTVTGVMKPIPHNTHFRPAILVSTEPHTGNIQWGRFNAFIYLRLREEATAADVHKKINDLVGATRKKQFNFSYNLQPVAEIHLNSPVDSPMNNEVFHFDKSQVPNSDRRYVMLFGFIGLLILGAAAINYMNLSTATFSPRAKEVGIRKSLGASRRELIVQFLTESVLLCCLAFPVALLLLELLKPVFTSISGITLDLDYRHDAAPLGIALSLTLIFGIFAGLYPSLFLSHFQPVETLKGHIKTLPFNRRMRQALLVVQFMGSSALLICTFIVFEQLKFIQEKRLGYDKENLLIIDAYRLKEKCVVFKEEVLKVAGVESATLSDWTGNGMNSKSLDKDSLGNTVKYNFFYVGDDFLKTMKLELLAGRDFLPSDGTTSNHLSKPQENPPPPEMIPMILNETACKMYGLTNPVGQVIHREKIKGTVIGVVKDFHFRDLRIALEPLVIQRVVRDYTAFGDGVTVRLRPDGLRETMRSIDSLWKIFSPEEPLSTEFLDQSLNTIYRSDERLAELFILFALISVFVACLGLFGLAAFTAEQRTKEIGIRKVLGASISGIVLMLSSEFLKLVVVAFVVACPAAYYAMLTWLDGFAYRAELGISLFVLSGLLGLAVAGVSISYQIIKTAMQNPVKSLRYE